MFKIITLANKYRKYINVALNTYDDFVKHYQAEFPIKNTENEKLSK